MKINGEFIFNSFEEAFSFVSEPTNYEKSNGISVVHKELTIDKEDFKLASFITNDGRIGLFLFFKNSKNYDVWKFWCPSEDQMESLQRTAEIYQVINRHNMELKKNG